MNAVSIENLVDVLDDKKLLKKFRIFLRGHLALENLLFYESIQMFEKTNSSDKRQETGHFMIDQFVKDDSEDVTNLSYQTRKKLEDLKQFELGSFDTAKHELFRLLDSNFFHKFLLYLEDEGDPVIQNFSPFLSKSYFKDLSYNNLEELLKKDKNGKISFLKCTCTPSSRDGSHKFCCEQFRGRVKLNKILRRMKKCTESKKRSLQWVRSSLANISVRLLPGKKIKKVSSGSVIPEETASYTYEQPLCASEYPCWQASPALFSI